MIKLLKIFGLLICANLAWANLQLPKLARVPGGVAYFTLPQTLDAPAPKVYYHDKPVLVVPHQKHWVAIIGIPITNTEHEDEFSFELDHQLQHQKFGLANKKYPESHITIRNQKLVNPDPELTQRIWREQKNMQAALQIWSSQIPDTLHLKLPTKGIYTTSFGAQRFINNQRRNIHSGLDIAAPSGRIVTAAAKGRVVLAANHVLTGNTIIIDHGQGFMTIYAHLSKIWVKVGDAVDPQTRIAAVGASGRVTGPHLHWGVSLNNTTVDPLLFL